MVGKKQNEECRENQHHKNNELVSHIYTFGPRLDAIVALFFLGIFLLLLHGFYQMYLNLQK